MYSSQEYQILKRERGISTLVGILIAFFAAIIVGAGIWAYYTYKIIPEIKKSETSTTTPTEDETANWKTLTLNFAGTLKYPPDWRVTKSTNSIDKSIISYFINYSETAVADGTISEYNLTEWLKGVGEDQPYVLSVSERKSALELLKTIYNEQKISSQTVQQFANFGLEFFPYSGKGAVDLRYLESTDGKSRGFTCINTTGQDVSIPGDYIATLYNPENNVVVSIMYRMSDYQEIKNINDQIENYYQSEGATADPEEVVKFSNQLYAEFKALVESSKRSDLTFGSLMDEVDKVLKSLNFN